MDAAEPSAGMPGGSIDAADAVKLDMSGGTLPEKGSAADPAAAMSAVLRELQLDDWEIKASELEIVRNADGSQCCLGQGAFGQVIFNPMAALMLPVPI